MTDLTQEKINEIFEKHKNQKSWTEKTARAVLENYIKSKFIEISFIDYLDSKAMMESVDSDATTLQEFAEDLAWNEKTQIDLTIEYIATEKELNSDFEAFLETQA